MAEFWKLAMQISKLSDDEAKYAYLEGLQSKFQELAISHKENIKDLHTLQAACLRFDSGTRQGNNNGNNEALMANTQFRKGNRHGSTKNRNGNDTDIHSEKPNSDETSATIVKKAPQTQKQKVCVICRKKGHYANKCFKLKDVLDIYDKACGPQSNYVSTAKMMIIDSGTTQHMFSDHNAFETLTPENATITCANSQSISATHVGTVKLNDSKTLKDVLLVPELQHNLISVSALTDEGDDITFMHKGTVLLNAMDDNPIQIGHAIGKLYHSETNLVSNKACLTNVDDYMLWHHRLGHPSRQTLLSMPKFVNGIDGTKLMLTDVDCKCAACIQAKATRQPFGNAENRATATIERVHMDLCGPMPIPSLGGGARYVLTFIDDYSRYATIYFLTNKSNTFENFLRFKALVEWQTGNKLKTLCSDGGGEYSSHEFHDYLADNGICHEMTIADMPQQNGVAERFNHTLFNATRALMHASNIPQPLWAELAATAAYLRNRTPMRTNTEGKTPFELWHGNKPDVDHLRIVWSDAYAYIAKSKCSKLAPKALKFKLIGYHLTKKAYRLWDPIKERIEFS